MELTFFYTPTALKISESKFMMVARAYNNNSNNNVRRDDIAHLVWDTNFVELNAKLYGNEDSVTLQAVKSISRYKNNPHVYIGGTDRYVVNPSGYDTSVGYYYLIKTDLNGDSIWTRYYSNDSYLQMQRVLATSDGGALMVGTSYDHTNSNGQEKDVWIVKVDSNGNYQNQTSIAENGSINKNEFVFFPNPLGDQLHFRQINVQREYNLEIFDIGGKKVLEKRISKSDETFDFSNLSSGTYIYHLLDENGNFASGKLMKK